jgi:hypothetical protein
MMNLKDLKHLDRDDLLNALGLESKPSTTVWLAGALGTFAVGLLVGAGLGLMFATKPGRELRGDIRNRLSHTHDDDSEPERRPHRG